EVDVTKALAPHLLPRHLDAAVLADDALVANALVLAAVALPVARRPEDALAEQAVALRLERAVVDRLRLGDLAGGPVADLLRRGEADPNCVEIVDVDQVSPSPQSSISRSTRSFSPRGPTSASASSTASCSSETSTSSRSPSASSAGSVSSAPVSSVRSCPSSCSSAVGSRPNWALPPSGCCVTSEYGPVLRAWILSSTRWSSFRMYMYPIVTFCSNGSPLRPL